MIVFISIGFSKNLVLQYRGNSREPTLNDEHNTEEIFQKASHYFSHQFCINLSLQKKKNGGNEKRLQFKFMCILHVQGQYKRNDHRRLFICTPTNSLG